MTFSTDLSNEQEYGDKYASLKRNREGDLARAMLFKCFFMFETAVPSGQPACASRLCVFLDRSCLPADLFGLIPGFDPPLTTPKDGEVPPPPEVAFERQENGDACERDLGSSAMQLCTLATLMLLLLLLLPTVLDGRSVHLQRESRRAS